MKGINEFITNVESNVQLQNELKKSQSPEGFLACAKKAGYSFTPQELTAALSVQNQSGELSDAQLEGVAGGVGVVKAIVGSIWGAITGGSCDGGSSGSAGVRG